NSQCPDNHLRFSGSTCLREKVRYCKKIEQPNHRMIRWKTKRLQIMRRLRARAFKPFFHQLIQDVSETYRKKDKQHSPVIFPEYPKIDKQQQAHSNDHPWVTDKGHAIEQHSAVQQLRR